MDTSSWIALAGLGAGATSAYLSNRQQNRNRQAAADEAELDREERRGTNLLDVASRESLSDPFRHQVNQVDALSRLDMIANATRTPSRINVPPEMARFVPQISGGFNYDASPDLRSAAKLLQRSVASGETAPTMTNPANYGLTGARNLNDPSSIGMSGRPYAPGQSGAPGVGGAIPRSPGTAGAAAGLPPTLNPYASGAAPGSAAYSLNKKDAEINLLSGNPAYQNYRRRREGAGGAGKGAMTGLKYGMMSGNPAVMGAAAVGGAIAGAFTKNAESAYEDFFLDDAKQILRDETKRMWGRQASEEEIQEALVGQGLKPGDRWVGQEGLDYILDQWALRAEQDSGDDDVFVPSYAGLFA